MNTTPIDPFKVDLAAAQALADAATPGPWSALASGVANGDHWYVCDEGESIAMISANDGVNEDQREPDALFIASARSLVPALISERREADAKLDKVRTSLSRLMDQLHETSNGLGDWHDATEYIDWAQREVRDIWLAVGGGQ